MASQDSILDNVQVFLAHAIRLESDAARRFEDLMHSMDGAGNDEVSSLFARLAEFSRKHLKAAQARGGFREIPEIKPGQFQWPSGVTPEAAGWWGVDGTMDVAGALDLALEGEQSGYEFYAQVATASTNPELVHLAQEFASEEAEHVAELERWIMRFGTPNASTPTHQQNSGLVK